MSKKKKSAKKTHTPEMKLGDAPGVALLKIDEIESKIAKYEKAKKARCDESPGEIAAKRELTAALQAHRDKLPANAEGKKFYRTEDREYILDEVLKSHKVTIDDDSGSSE